METFNGLHGDDNVVDDDDWQYQSFDRYTIFMMMITIIIIIFLEEIILSTFYIYVYKTLAHEWKRARGRVKKKLDLLKMINISLRSGSMANSSAEKALNQSLSLRLA